MWLAAENGIYMRPPGLDWITLLEVRVVPAHARQGLHLQLTFSGSSVTVPHTACMPTCTWK